VYIIIRSDKIKETNEWTTEVDKTRITCSSFIKRLSLACKFTFCSRSSTRVRHIGWNRLEQAGRFLFVARTV